MVSYKLSVWCNEFGTLLPDEKNHDRICHECKIVRAHRRINNEYNNSQSYKNDDVNTIETAQSWGAITIPAGLIATAVSLYYMTYKIEVDIIWSIIASLIIGILTYVLLMWVIVITIFISIIVAILYFLGWVELSNFF